LEILGIIPARFASTRFPGKPLVVIDEKTMIQRVYEQAKKSAALNDVVVATDNEVIAESVRKFGGKVMLTAPEHENGTSRCAEVLTRLEKENPALKIDVVINIQGDEPYINPAQIDSLASLFYENKTEIGTLIKEIKRNEELFNPNVVKTIINSEGKALYFSRHPIPFLRDFPENKWLNNAMFYKHIGIYGYKNDVLKRIVKLPPGKLEKAEKLEQLRWLENNFSIYTNTTDFEGVAIDTPEDLLKLTNNPC